MADFDHNPTYAQTGAALDAGLRRHMARVFNLMGLSLFVSAAVSYFAAESGIYLSLAQSSPGLLMAVNFAPLGILFFLMFKLNSIQQSTLQMLFWTFVVLEGFSLGYVSLVYTGASVARVFLITALTFSTCAFYGYTTKRDLAPFATFLMVALVGLIIAMVVNFFMQSSAMQFAISAIGVLVFAGITAWNVQDIKNTYLQLSSAGAAGTAMLGKASVMGTLSLYIAFLNMFIMLLQLFGDRR